MSASPGAASAFCRCQVTAMESFVRSGSTTSCCAISMCTSTRPAPGIHSSSCAMAGSGSVPHDHEMRSSTIEVIAATRSRHRRLVAGPCRARPPRCCATLVHHDLHDELAARLIELPRSERADHGALSVRQQELVAVPGRHVQLVTRHRRQEQADARCRLGENEVRQLRSRRARPGSCATSAPRSFAQTARNRGGSRRTRSPDATRAR